MIGLDRGAAKDALAEFLAGNNLTANQIEFIDMVINYLTDHGVMSAARLYESPFTDLAPRGPDELFRTKKSMTSCVFSAGFALQRLRRKRGDSCQRTYTVAINWDVSR